VVPKVLYKQRESFQEELKFLSYQHMRKAQEVYAKEEVIAGVLQEEQRLELMLLREKEDNGELLAKMDNELRRLERKEILCEKDKAEQMDNVERRIEYERHKNQKIQKEIDGEVGKIDKIKDKYKDRLSDMQEKYEEMEKDLKFA
jgi:hypothetical protein